MPNVCIDMSFNDLTVVAAAASRKQKSGRRNGKQRFAMTRFWLCKCICETLVEVAEHNLVAGNTKSCGCRKIHRLSAGDKFNRLTVVEQGPHKKFSSRSAGYEHTWVCTCDCGKTATVRAYALVSGTTKSCGCLAAEVTGIVLPLGEAAFHTRVQKLKKMARERSISFELTQEQCRTLLTSECHWCGLLPDREYVSTAQIRKTGVFIGAGVDRLDSAKGYTLDNCVSSCQRCNCGKWTQTSEEFLEWIKTVYERFYAKSGD